MTPEVQIAITAAVAPVVAALGVILVAVIHDRRAGKKLDTIAVVTNGTAARMQAKVDGLELLVRQLLVERSGCTSDDCHLKRTAAETKARIDAAAVTPAASDTP